MAALMILVDAQAFIIVLGTVMLTAALAGKYKILVIGINSALSKRYQILERDRVSAIKLFRLTTKTTAGVAVISLFVSLPFMLRDYADMPSFLQNALTASLPGLYSVIFNTLFFYPAIHALGRRDGE